jgi:phosphatidylserine decarboxylase
MASSFPEIPTPFVPSDQDQHIAVTGLHKLVQQAQTGEHAPHETTTHSGFTAYVRNAVNRESLEDFENSWHLGNYVIDRKTGEKTFENMSIYVRLGMHFIYYGPAQERVLKWKQARDILAYQTRQMGIAYDSQESKAHIQPFINSFKLQDSLSELLEPDPTKYRTFNQFFARELKPGARPVEHPDDPLVFSSPADCRLSVFPTVDLATAYWIKGYGFKLAKLLEDEGLASQFEGGSITIARLAPQDYHRWHSPVTGTVLSIKEIPGTYYTVNPQAINQAGTLDVFCENRRSVMIIRREPTNNPVVLVAVGAMLVGSIKYNSGIEEGAEIKRGQCLGSFQYGGSTVIMLCPKSEMMHDVDLLRNSMEHECETYVKVGWSIGKGPI